MTFEVIRAIQDQEENGVVVASGFETEVDAIRYASQKDHDYFYHRRDYCYPCTYHTTRVLTGGVISTEEIVDSDYSDKVLQDWGLSYERAKLEGLI